MARKRRFSEDSFGPTIERLMGEAGLTYRSLAEKTRLSAGYLNHLVHGNLVRQQREGDDDRRRDDAEDDRVLGHRLSAFASAVGSNAVEPARGSHIRKDRRGRLAPVCLVLGIRPK